MPYLVTSVRTNYRETVPRAGQCCTTVGSRCWHPLHHAFISCLFRPSTLTACSLMRVDILSRQASSSSTLSSQDTSCTMLPACWPVQPRKLTPELKQTSNPWPGWPFTISKGKYKEFSSITITKQRNKTPHLSPNISCIYSLLKKGW